MILAFTFFGCNKDDDNTPVDFSAPTISISSPTIPADGLEIEIGATETITLSVNAEAGLNELTVDGTSIKTFGGSVVTGTADYQISPSALGDLNMQFKITDSQEKEASVSLQVRPVEPPVPPYVLIDFTGESTSVQEDVDIGLQGWDIRDITTFSVGEGVSNSMTIEHVASQAQSFPGMPDPADASKKALQIITAPPAGTDTWGGHYSFSIINLGANIPVDELNALPQYDSLDVDDKLTDDYTRVIQVDAYYDDTGNSSLSFFDIQNLDPIPGLDPSKGYQIDIALVNHEVHAAVIGEVEGFHQAYSAWITEPNQWVTLTFNVISEGEEDFLKKTSAVGADQVDGIDIIPMYAHSIWDDPTFAATIDSNTDPIYFRNLRIVNR